MCPEIRPFSWNWHTPYCSNEAPDSSPCKSPLNVWVPLLSHIPYQCWLSEGTSEADFPEWLRRQWFWLIFHLSAHPPTHFLTYHVLIHSSTRMSIHLPIIHLMSIHLPIYPPTHPPSISPTPHLPTHTFIHVAIYQLTNPSIHSQLFQQFTVSCALSHK